MTRSGFAGEHEAEGLATTHQAQPQDSRHRRKLIGVLYADMVGYSRLIGLDDVGALERLKTLRYNLIDPATTEHGGRIVQTRGDSLLVVFDSIDGAVRCAVKVQRQVPIHEGHLPPDQAIRFRVGINIGDAIVGGIFGDGSTLRSWGAGRDLRRSGCPRSGAGQDRS